jgi:hypothetical protein
MASHVSKPEICPENINLTNTVKWLDLQDKKSIFKTDISFITVKWLKVTFRHFQFTGYPKWDFLLILFMSMGRDYVSELRTPMGLSFIPQTMHEYGQPRWNDNDRGKPKNSERDLSQCDFIHHKSQKMKLPVTKKCVNGKQTLILFESKY